MTEIFLSTQTPKMFNEISEEIRLFFSVDKVTLIEDLYEEKTRLGLCFVHTILNDTDLLISKVEIYEDRNKKAVANVPFRFVQDAVEDKRSEKFAVKHSFYLALKKLTHKKLPWGALTGVRPTRMLRDFELRLGSRAAKKKMRTAFDVSLPKYKLTKKIIENQKAIVQTASAEKMDVYIGIPFCPSICAYCSFSSTKTYLGDDQQKLYMDALIKELHTLATVTDAYEIRSIYVGGGTPTSLDDDHFMRLLREIKQILPGVSEFTVEAGRPDTITEHKLMLMKRFAVTRMSINPQTFKPSTLKVIGRNHTLQQFESAFQLARNMGFNNINIDLIFGLPNESISDMKTSLKKALALSPESITIHTLAIKKSSKFSRDSAYQVNKKAIARALIFSQKRCARTGMKPYYMYRQKYMKGNLENVGYCKQGYASVYNIDMMEEICSIMALGAGSISKRIFPGPYQLKRNANVKNVDTYITRIESVIEKQKKLFDA